MSSPVRSEVQKLRRANPFRPFVLAMHSGERVTIRHPENIAFDPGMPAGASASDEFCAISGELRLFSNLGAVRSVEIVDRAEV